LVAGAGGVVDAYVAVDIGADGVGADVGVGGVDGQADGLSGEAVKVLPVTVRCWMSSIIRAWEASRVSQ